jgi:hypothetical protein
LLFTKYYSSDKIRKTGMGWACGFVGDERDAYRVVVGKPEGNGQLGRQKHKWDYNIKKDLK